jgi:cell division protein FtsB
MTIATPAPEEEAERRKKGPLGVLTEHWLPFVTALLTLIAAGLGVWAAQLSGERSDLRVTVENQEESLGDLETTNSSLVEENARLSEQLERAEATTTTTSLPDPNEEPEAVQEVLRTSAGPVVVPEGDGIDLDSPEDNWGVTGGSHDFGVSSGADSLTGSWDGLIAVVPGPPDVRTCEAQTVTEQVLPVAQTVVGQHLCVQSNEGRWAYVHIAGIDTENDTISFDITVWKLTTDP